MAVCRKFLFLTVPVASTYYYFGCGDSFEPESVRGKRVLVTGASSGIGEKVALKYAHLGAELVITARRKDLLKKVTEKCKQVGAKNVLAVPADMELPAHRKKVVDTTLRELGGLDFLILNHAYMDFAFWKGTAQNMTKLEKMTNINFFSYVDLTSGFLPALEKSKGHIGVVSSLAGKFASFASAPYCSTKHALQGFYSSLRLELQHRKTGVSVTLVVFGLIDSERMEEIMAAIPTTIDLMKLAGSEEAAADVLVKGVSARDYEVFYPFASTFASKLFRAFPFFVQDLQKFLLAEGTQL